MEKILLIIVFLTFPALASAAETGYAAPDLSKAKLVFEEKQYIATGAKPAEINIMTYSEPDGTKVRVYSVGGSIFRYDVAAKPGAYPPYDYRLIDKDGDGVFETKESMIGEMPVNEKGTKYFIDLGPEPGKEYKYSYEDVKSPGPLERRQLIMGYPIYIPQWVLLRWSSP